jgi:hypothetical protein
MTGEEGASKIVAFVTGGAAFGIVEFLYKVLRTRTEDRKRQTESAESRLDPVVKSADQLSAKLRALGERDFLEVPQRPGASSLNALVEYLNVLYLVVEFWAQIEVLRASGSYWELARDKRGLQLASFLRCLESRDVRLVSRAMQRGLGESLIADTGKVISFHAFVLKYQADEGIRQWLEPLSEMLDATRVGAKKTRRKMRQRWLQYGVIVHALIDTLDEEHHVGRDRPGLPNKLSDRTKRDLRNRVFKLYLPDVRRSHKYLSAKV